MADMFDKVLADVREANGGKDDELVLALQQKQEELGADASEEDIAKAIQECFVEHLMGAISDGEDTNIVLEKEEAEKLLQSRETVREFLSDNEWHFSERELRPDLTLFELGFNVQNVSIRIRIHVEAKPDVCRISAFLPITADQTYEYPLCSAMAKENYQKRFGSFKYDERDGEVSYEHSFLIKKGVDKDELDIYFHAVVSSAAEGYDVIRKNCVGKYKNKEISEILEKVNNLVTDISE